MILKLLLILKYLLEVNEIKLKKKLNTMKKLRPQK